MRTNRTGRATREGGAPARLSEHPSERPPQAARAGEAVRARRLALGLSQAELAERASLTRQSVGAIEAGRATPAVDVALRLARALERTVEALFAPPRDETPIEVVAAASAAASGRVTLARVGGRWVSHPLGADGLRHSADALVVTTRAARETRSSRGTLDQPRALARPLGALAAALENVVLMGCAAGLGLVAHRLGARPGPGRFVWLSTSSAGALSALARGLTHVAGLHVVEGGARDESIAAVERAGAPEPLTIVTMARWEEGLLTRHADRERVPGVAALGAPDVRLVGRERGAGAQRVLERELRRAGLGVERARAPALVAAGHLDVARAIAMGAADAGVASRDAALALELRFVPLVEERYDLVLPTALLGDARIERLFDVLASKAMRADLDALGYDVTAAGQRVAEVAAA